MRTTPMLEQYAALKRETPDAILLYRLGDFYEMFFEDAVVAAPLLGLVLTARHKDSDIEAPMCGVPHHALESYVAKLVAAGKKVAISEQTEAASKGKSLVARRIVRVITPGTIVDAERLDARRANELASVAFEGEHAALGFLDVSTGEFSVLRLTNGTRPEEWLERRPVREVVCFPSDQKALEAMLGRLSEPPVVSVLAGESPRGRSASDLLLAHFRTSTLDAFGLPPGGAPVEAAAALLHYAKTTQRADCAHVVGLRTETGDEGLVVDAVTSAHLELFRSLRDGGRSGSLIDVLDRTGTAFGARSLRRMVERPLGRTWEIEARHDAIEELLETPARLEELARALSGIPDLPRTVARISVGAGSPRDLLGLAEGLVRSAALEPILAGMRSDALRPDGEASAHGVPAALGEKLRAELVEAPPATAREGEIFRNDVDVEVDDLRQLRRGSREVLAGLEADERSRRGIPNLRVKFNNVVGHVFEVPASARGKIPEDALKRQTLANAERYATRELVEVDEKLRTADSRLAEREYRLFQERCAGVVAAAPSILAAVTRIGRLDALVSLARVARSAGWCRPRLVEEPLLSISDGRHPVVEALRGRREPFIPNDTTLGAEQRLIVLTGPNMGGKSTYLRQNALIVLLAHAGSYVPAASAAVGLCDRIFTRVGASDSLTRGESTFLVEMAETAHILRHATRRSLVVLDEVGRGTSTFDGLSLAWAIAERLHDGENGSGNGPARVLFATHYHELTELALVKPAVVNRRMAVKEWEGNVLFLRKVTEGAADRSYGVQVARLAGIPEPVLTRAKEILGNLERQQLDVGGRPKLAEHAGEPEPREVQLDLFRGQGEVVLDALEKVDLEKTTPLVALNLLASFQARLRGES